MATKTHVITPGWKELLSSYTAQHFPDERLQARLQGEDVARRLLEEKLGNFSEEDIRSFLSALNADLADGKERHNRFMPAFYGSLANQIVECRDAFNRWTERIWKADDDRL